MMPNEQIKASLFNLIIYTHEKQRTDYFIEIVHKIIEKFPCRVIFIQTDDVSEISVTKETIDRGLNYVCCDLIKIETPTKDLDTVPFIMMQHLIPDLPIYLIWGQDPTAKNPLFPHILKIANRIVFDSESLPDLRKFSRLMLFQIASSQIDIMDVDWALISRWRQVIANTFDSPEKLDLLNSATKIIVAYNNRLNPYSRFNDTRAIYLQAWLASNLEWEFKDIKKTNEDLILTYKTPQGVTEMVLHPEICDKLHPASILEVDVESKSCGTIKISRFEDQPKVYIHASNQEKCELPYTLPLFDLQQGLTFVKEMFFYPPSDHYRKMLAYIEKVNWEES